MVQVIYILLTTEIIVFAKLTYQRALSLLLPEMDNKDIQQMVQLQIQPNLVIHLGFGLTIQTIYILLMQVIIYCGLFLLQQMDLI